MRGQTASGVLPNRAALYIRLSKEDAGDGESASIGTQRALLTRYAREHGLSIVDEYVDDGYSGTSFDRPAYRRMVADLERGRINCVITKDSSRLGRNGARLLDLLDNYFPLHGIRYISVNDGYDSAALSSGAAAAMPFMAVVNEFYARDISAKIRSSLHTKMESGAYVASLAPYGYRKDAEDKNHLVVDPAAAPIVRDIFRAAADGRRPSEIAKALNDRGVATPAEYRRRRSPYRGGDADGHGAWTAAGICKMLSNEVYLGKTLQGKSQRVSFKNRQVRAMPREQWYIRAGTHEPIIDEETFRAVRERCVARRSPAAGGFENIFSGIARCADCGHTMSTTTSRRRGARCSLVCGSYKSHGAGACSSHAIDYDTLYAAVQQELRTLISLTPAERRAIADALSADARAQRQRDPQRQAFDEMRRERERLRAKMIRLYEDFAECRITAATYESVAPQYEAEMSALKCSLRRTEEALQRFPQDGSAARDAFLARLDDMIGVTELSRPLLRSLIDRIEIEQGVCPQGGDGKRRRRQTVRIYYRFSEPSSESGEAQP